MDKKYSLTVNSIDGNMKVRRKKNHKNRQGSHGLKQGALNPFKKTVLKQGRFC